MHHKIHIWNFLDYLLCSAIQVLVHSVPCPISLHTSFCTVLQSLVKTYIGSLVYPEMTAVPSFLDVGGSMSVSACTFLQSGLMPCQEIILPKNGILVHLKKTLIFASFKFSCLHTLSTLSNVSSWAFPSSSKPHENIRHTSKYSIYHLL